MPIALRFIKPNTHEKVKTDRQLTAQTTRTMFSPFAPTTDQVQKAMLDAKAEQPRFWTVLARIGSG